MSDKKLKDISGKDSDSFFTTWGERLFKVRSYTPIPLFVTMFFYDWWELEKDILVWSTGLFLVTMGESIRLWTLRYIGKCSRTRKRKCKLLIKEGPYSFSLNPLYCGNLLILLGFTILSELMWLIPIGMFLFCLQYSCIVKWEESILLEDFPSDAERYFKSVPRWLPKWHTMRNHSRIPFKSNYSWSNALQREKSTLQFIAVMNSFMILKEFFY